MATVQYGSLQLIPPPQLGISVRSNFFGADIRYSTTKVYSLKGALLNNQTSGVSGIFLQQNDLVTGFLDYQPFIVNGVVVGYPKVNSFVFDESNYLQKDGYSIELEFLDSGNPFQLTGSVYGFTGVTGLFHNIESLTEDLTYNTDFKTFNYSQSVNVVYRTGVGIDPLLNAKFIASGLINNKSAIPFVVTGGAFGTKTYEENTDTFNGIYGVTEKFNGATGTGAYNHTYSVNVNLGQNGITSVSQNGTILGFDPNKYENAKSGYNDVRANMYQTCSGAYARYVGGVLNDTYLSDSRVDDILGATIQYSRSYTDQSGIVSGVIWQYTHSMTLDNNKIRASENGNIVGQSHISTRFNVASGVWDSVRPGIDARTLSFYSGFQQTGLLYNVSRTQTFDRFNGQIGYGYDYSNDGNFGFGSGVRSLNVTISDGLPTANRVVFSVVHVGQLIQSLNSTKQGERTIGVEMQLFRETPKQTGLQVLINTLNKYSPIEIGKIDPFLNSLSITENPIVNQFSCNAQYLYGGYSQETSLNI